MIIELFLLGVGLVVGIRAIARSVRQLTGRRRWLGILGGVALGMGFVTFVGMGTTLGRKVPLSWEWPVGRSEQIILLSDGNRVVKHEPVGRIQVYDEEWRFVRAWHVEDHGGVFTVSVTPDENLEVWTARGNHRFIYTLEGELIEDGTYSVRDFDELKPEGEPGWVPTPIILLPFTSPVFAWFMGLGGMLLLHRVGVMTLRTPFSRNRGSPDDA